jgi:DNA-binding NarL/FixJ family response regulator
MPAARILLADDHDIVRQGICALVGAEAGWEVCGEARTGREAVRLAGELRPDAVIMDILMPDLNGLDAARLIRKGSASVAILILSGHEDENLIRPAFEAGIGAYIFKSQARAHLIPALGALLAGGTYVTPEVSVILGRAAGRRPGMTGSVLTAREREIIQLIAEGRGNKEMAAALGIGAKTVETHRAAIMRKLNIDSVGGLVRYAIRNKIVEG